MAPAEKDQVESLDGYELHSFGSLNIGFYYSLTGQGPGS